MVKEDLIDLIEGDYLEDQDLDCGGLDGKYVNLQNNLNYYRI
jgi:hypothetical protein